MRKIWSLVAGMSMLFPATASAEWRAANPQVTEAARNPRVAAALAAAMRMDKAILAHDAAGFSAGFAADAVINNPFNRIARKADAERNMRTGLIDYAALDRVIEYAAARGQHDVVLMGEEHLKPVGKARMAGKAVKRRTSEIWTDATGEWKLALRQATIYAAE